MDLSLISSLYPILKAQSLSLAKRLWLHRYCKVVLMSYLLALNHRKDSSWRYDYTEKLAEYLYLEGLSLMESADRNVQIFIG